MPTIHPKLTVDRSAARRTVLRQVNQPPAVLAENCLGHGQLGHHVGRELLVAAAAEFTLHFGHGVIAPRLDHAVVGIAEIVGQPQFGLLKLALEALDVSL